jgi:hypothetical protein
MDQYFDNITVRADKYPETINKFQFEAESNFDSLTYLYEETPPNNPARRLIVDFYAGRIKRQTFIAGKASSLADFVFDLAVRLIDQLPVSGLGGISLQNCFFYHESRDDHEKGSNTAGTKDGTAKPQ